MGWERPNWFSKEKHNQTPHQEYTFGKPTWLAASAQEHKATRESVAVFDQSSFAKFTVDGPDSQQLMNRLCANDMEVEVGKVVYTGMLNSRGGFETDCTVTKTGENQFFVVSPTAQATRDFDWITSNILPHENVHVADVSSHYSVISVMGPKSRDVLQSLTSSDMSNKGFGFGTSQNIQIGCANVRASRITYVGELGWELYAPVDSALTLYSTLTAHPDVVDGGYYAIETLRLEKGYRAWGHELSPDHTPLEAGLGFAVAFHKKDKNFIGREALERQKEAGVSKRLVMFKFSDPEAYPHGGEPILMQNCDSRSLDKSGKVVGYLSSAGYGHTIGVGLGMGFITHPDALKLSSNFIKNAKFSVSIAGTLFDVLPSLSPFYDPKNLKIKN